jgi:preprotein translocase subunit SecE
MNFFKRVQKFILEVVAELRKVSWSTRPELIGSTSVVIVLTSLIAVFIFLVDTILFSALKRLLGM